MSEHFIILGLPRSMTAWVSCFLTCGDVFCQHELAEHEPMELALEKIPQPFAISGVCDSGLLFYHEWVREKYPNAKYLWIERPQEDAEDSFMAATGTSRAQLGMTFQGWRIEKELFLEFTKPEVFTFDELQTEEGAKRLWDYVAPSVPLPPAHLAKMMTLKVVVHPKVYAEAAATLNALTTA